METKSDDPDSSRHKNYYFEGYLQNKLRIANRIFSENNKKWMFQISIKIEVNASELIHSELIFNALNDTLSQDQISEITSIYQYNSSKQWIIGFD